MIHHSPMVTSVMTQDSLQDAGFEEGDAIEAISTYKNPNKYWDFRLMTKSSK